MKVLKDRGYTYGDHWGPHDIENREFGSDAKSRKELAREGYEIDGQVYSMTFKVVPKLALIPASSQCVKFCLSVSLMKRNALKALLIWKATEKSGMTSAAAGKINHFTITHLTALMGSATLL